MIDITGFVFLLLIGFCLFLDWLDGDLIWDKDTLTLTSRKVKREQNNEKNNYNLSWKDMQ
ncbi:MAG: hypothetical protein ACOCRO_00500 [Halanaerobiales bacterium]